MIRLLHHPVQEVFFIVIKKGNDISVYTLQIRCRENRNVHSHDEYTFMCLSFT